MLSLETALVIPLVVLAMGLIVQLSWVGFQSACFDHALGSAAWRLRADASLAANPEQAVRRAIEADWTPLDREAVAVHAASVSAQSRSESEPTNGPLDKFGYLIERTTREVQTVRTQANVSYEIRPIVALPGFRTVTIERTLDRSFVSQSRFEVS